MTQAQRPTNRDRERDPEHARTPTAAVVARFLAEPLELDRSKPLYAEELFFVDRHDRRQVRATLQLLL